MEQNRRSKRPEDMNAEDEEETLLPPTYFVALIGAIAVVLAATFL